MEQFEKAMTTEQVLVDDKKGSLEDLAFYYNNMGLCHYHKSVKHPDFSEQLMVEALLAYDNAIKLNPDNAIHFFNRGNVFLNIKNYESAHQNFDKALEHENTNPKFYHAKGLAFQTESESIADKERK